LRVVTDVRGNLEAVRGLSFTHSLTLSGSGSGSGPYENGRKYTAAGSFGVTVMLSRAVH